MLSEKSERIKKMLEEGTYTWNAIMRELHVGPHTIRKVQDAINRSKAFEMFENNWSLHQVSLKLDISSDKVKKYQLEYLELKGQDELVHHLKDKDISNLVPIAREMKARKRTPEQIETVLKLSISVTQLEHERAELSESIRLERSQLEHERAELSESIRLERIKFAKLCEEKSKVENQLNNLEKQKGSLLQETAILESRHKVYRRALENICKSKELSNVRQIVDNTSRSILEDKKILFCAAAVSIIRAMSNNPQSITLFSDPASTEKLASFFLDPGPPGNEIWIYRVAKSMFEDYVDFLAKGIVGCTINTLGDSKYENLTEQLSAEISQLMTLHKHSPFLNSLFRN
jgi:hypothetical protein